MKLVIVYEVQETEGLIAQKSRFINFSELFGYYRTIEDAIKKELREGEKFVYACIENQDDERIYLESLKI